MVYKRLNYCAITQSATYIVRPFVADERSSWYRTLHGYNTGCDIIASEVYSACFGVVIQVGHTTQYTVTVQYDANSCVRYANLTDVDVSPGEPITTGRLIGHADEFVRVEYATQSTEFTRWPVHIGTETYYKVDPESIVDGTSLITS